MAVSVPCIAQIDKFPNKLSNSQTFQEQPQYRVYMLSIRAATIFTNFDTCLALINHRNRPLVLRVAIFSHLKLAPLIPSVIIEDFLYT